jgi:hypothetical protein
MGKMSTSLAAFFREESSLSCTRFERRETPTVWGIHRGIEVANKQSCVSVNTEANSVIREFSPLCACCGVRLGGWSHVRCYDLDMFIGGCESYGQPTFVRGVNGLA